MTDELYGRAIVRVEADTRRALQEIRAFTRRAESHLRGAERAVSGVNRALLTLTATSTVATRRLNDLDDSTGRLRGQMTGLRTTVRTAGGALRSVGDPANNAARGVREAGLSVRDFKLSLLSLATAALPAAAAMAPIAAGAFAAGGALTAFTVAVVPQITALSDAADAETKYQDAIREHGRASKQAADAEAAYLRQIADMPPATRRAAASVSALKDEFKDWSNDLAEFTMVPVTKGLDLTRALLPKLTPLVRGTSREFSHFMDVLAGASQTSGFDRFTDAFTEFATSSLAKATTGLVRFTQAADEGEIGKDVRAFLAYARENGPIVADTFQELVEAGLHLAVGFSDVGVSALTVVNALARLVNAVPPSFVSVLVQSYAALKLLRLGIAGVTAVTTSSAVASLSGFARAAQFGGVGPAISGVVQRMSLLQKAGGALGVLGVVAYAIDQLAEKARGAPPDVDKLTTSLKTLAVTGKFTGELDKTFGSIDGLTAKFRQLKTETDGLDVARPILDLAPGGPIVEHLTGKIDDLARGSKSLAATKEDFEGLDKALASLTSGGHADLAAEQFQTFRKELIASGASTKEINALFPQYKASVAAVKAEQELAARGMGLFGDQAVATGEKLTMQKQSADGLRQSIQALNDVNRAGLGAMNAFEQAIDDTAKAAQENAGALRFHNGELDLNSQKARDAEAALRGLAAKTDEATAAAREQGKSWETVNGIYSRGRQKLIESAQAMGLTKKEAEALAAQILKTPNKTSKITMKVDDAKRDLKDFVSKVEKAPNAKSVTLKTLSKTAESVLRQFGYKVEHLKDGSVKVTAQTGTALSRISGVRSALVRLNGKTATTYVKTLYVEEHSTPKFRARGGPIGYAGGGRIPRGFPDGGTVMGPGSSTSDSVPAMLSRGEFVVRAAAVQRYGSALFERLNAMALPSLDVSALRAQRAGIGRSVGTVRTGTTTAPAAVNITLNLTNHGAIGSRLELDNWLAKAIDRLNNQRRLPRAA